MYKKVACFDVGPFKYLLFKVILMAPSQKFETHVKKKGFIKQNKASNSNWLSSSSPNQPGPHYFVTVKSPHFSRFQAFSSLVDMHLLNVQVLPPADLHHLGVPTCLTLLFNDANPNKIQRIFSSGTKKWSLRKA